MPKLTNVYCYGDSITQGPAGTNRAEGGSGNWIERTADALAATSLGPLLSSGMRGLWNSKWFAGTPPFTTHGGEWDGSGTWTPLAQSLDFNRAPHGQGWYGNNGADAVATWTLPANWPTSIVGFAVYYIDYPDAGAWQYQVDGGAWDKQREPVRHDNNLKKVYFAQSVESTLSFRQFDGSKPAGLALVAIEVYWNDPRATAGLIVHNLGRNGYWLGVTSGMLAKNSGADPLACLDSVALGTDAVDQRADIVTLEYINDHTIYKNDEDGGAERWKNNLEILGNRIARLDIPLIVFGMYELIDIDPVVQARYRTNSRSFAETHPRTSVFDIFEAWSAAGYGSVGSQSPLIDGHFLFDGMHPNEAGCADIAQRLFSYLGDCGLYAADQPNAEGAAP